MRNRKGPDPPTPMGPNGQAVIDRLVARLNELTPCGHDLDGFGLWIATRPGKLLCASSYQAAQVLAGDIRCTACGRPADEPDQDPIVILKVNEGLGAHFYLCQPCADYDLRAARTHS